MNWTKISEEVDSLPPLDVPVWLWLPDIAQPIIGERAYDEGENCWFWGRCYGDPYFSGDVWKSNDCEIDDIKPTHWMPLPQPPT